MAKRKRACLSGGIAAGALALFVFVAAPALPARALDARMLAGWWIAIDDAFPKLWESGAEPIEEVLIVNADGRFEDRAMNFAFAGAQMCDQRKICSDLPIIASGRLRFANDQLSIAVQRVWPDRLDSARNDPAIRRLAVSATPAWAIAEERGALTLRAGEHTRVFAKIEPRRLQRLRAGMRVAGLPPQKHWRCFLGNATAGNPAFAVLHKPDSGAPEWLDRYLRIASYLMTLDAMVRRPTADEPETARFIANEPENLLQEEFAGVIAPASRADTARVRAQVAAIEERVRGWMAAAGTATPSKKPQGAISDAEIAAFALAASNDAAAKKLFCRE